MPEQCRELLLGDEGPPGLHRLPGNAGGAQCRLAFAVANAGFVQECRYEAG